MAAPVSATLRRATGSKRFGRSFFEAPAEPFVPERTLEA